MVNKINSAGIWFAKYGKRLALPAGKHARILYGVKVVLLLAYIYVQLCSAKYAAIDPLPLDDTPVYSQMAEAPLLSKSFLAGLKPPMVPFVYKVCTNNYGAIIYLQTIVSAACWLLLAWAFSGAIRNRIVRYAAFLLMIVMGLSMPVALWNGCLLSESISISLMAAVVGSWILVVRNVSWMRWSLLLLCTLLWLFCRVTNAWILLLVGVLCIGVQWVTKERRYLIYGAVVVCAFMLNEVSGNVGRRWVFPLLNVFSQRILTDSTRTDQLVARGMPSSAAVLAMNNKWASSDDYAFYKSPALAEFREWFFSKGKQAYYGWLIRHPATLLREPLENIELLLASGIMPWYGSPSGVFILPHCVSKCIFPVGYERYFSLPMVWLIVLCTGMAIGGKLWKSNKLCWVIISMVFLTYPHILLVWHGDVMEVPRHSMLARVQLNIAWWMMLFIYIDLLTNKIQRQKREERAG